MKSMAWSAMLMAARMALPFSAVLMAELMAIPAVAIPLSVLITDLPVSPRRSLRTEHEETASSTKSKQALVASPRFFQSRLICCEVFLDPSCCFLNTSLRAVPRALNGLVSSTFFLASSSLSRTAFRSAGFSFRSAVLILFWMSFISFSICSTVRLSRSAKRFFQLSVCISIWALRADSASASPWLIIATRSEKPNLSASSLSAWYCSVISSFCSSKVL